MTLQNPSTLLPHRRQESKDARPNGHGPDWLDAVPRPNAPQPEDGNDLESEDSYDQRLLEFKSLVRRYILQLRYGCTSSVCTTPHCHSCKTRFAKAPIRRPNPYTARMQAYALATRSQPYAALCPHPPKVQAQEYRLSTDKEQPLALYVDNEEQGATEGTHARSRATYEPEGTITMEEASFTDAEIPIPVTSYEVIQRADSTENDTNEAQKNEVNAIPVTTTWSAFHVSLQSKKDFKSLTQCLFDTAALKSFEKSNKQSLQEYSACLHTSRRHLMACYCSSRSYKQSPTSTLCFADKVIFGLESWDPEVLIMCADPGPGRNDFPPYLEFLSLSLGPLFSPPSFRPLDNLETTALMRSTDGGYVSDDEALAIILYCFAALPRYAWFRRLHTLKRTKWAKPTNYWPYSKSSWKTHQIALESEPVLRLVDHLVRAIAARRCHYEITTTANSSQTTSTSSRARRSSFPLMEQLFKHFASVQPSDSPKGRWSLTGLVVDLLEALIGQKWDGEMVVNRWSAVGSAMEILNDMYMAEDLLGLRFDAAPIKNIFDDSLHDQSLVLSFMKHQPSPNSRHVLSFPVLFLGDIVRPFRTINYAKMFEAYRSSGYVHSMSRGFRNHLSRERVSYLNDRFAVANAKFLYLDVRREHVLEDAFDQLRGRQRRELIKPLKVRVGQDEGEVGVDQGGVTQEFFRVVFRKAFDDDYGMFTTDSRTHMSWIRTFSLVSLYQWELVGLLMSLAIYNGAVVPLNLPFCMYNRLLTGREPETIEEIQDGWPDLANGLRQLQDWDPANGGVADIFAREYKFTVNTPLTDVAISGYTYTVQKSSSGPEGFMVDYDLRNWKQTLTDYVQDETDEKTWNGEGHSNGETSSYAGMVTNENRFAFIKEYIRFLTVTSIEPQYQAFARGFHTCLDPAALSILTPKYLQLLVEGQHDLDMSALEENTRYMDGYSSTHPLIVWFWDMVKSWSAEKQRSLLEFVTASDRVPISGVSSIQFAIQRNGSDSDNLPTSTTCFGRLLIPEYGSREKLGRKLDIALEIGAGFGTM